ncbi:helix-turn-helix domain-containing protein [Mycobacterium sp. DL440]|uniref:helix-turn-helix domain-containing protein n=1 Tax=Mycobacterium sp. DL440 TaxID=2675523 RepID=UPI001AAFD55E|nr:helix-turn-helix domain-containing protein [Mycobacterium sp. DL440]
MTQPRWATEQEATEHARVSASTLRRWRAQGLITGHKIGRTVRYDLAEIDAMFTSSQEVGQ